MNYVTSQQMKEIDRRTQEEFGISAIVLMENAGQSVARVALDMLSGRKEKRVVCVCGKGNNGGDGFVCARHLINNGINTDVFLVGDKEGLKGEAKVNCDVLQKMGKTIKTLHEKDLASFENELKGTQLIIDAIFGTGLEGEVKEPYRSVIRLMNSSGKPVLSVDVPSGLDATEGKVLGVCVKATKTVTFGLPKTGFVRNDGPLHVGEVIVEDISIPKTLLTQSCRLK